MFDLVCGLIGFGLFVFVLAAIGHGLWLLGAMLVKALASFDQGGKAAGTSQQPCRKCGSYTGMVGGKCCYCGAKEGESATLSLTQEVEVTLKHLERLYRRGIVSDDEYLRIQAACRRDLDRLAGREVAPLPVPDASAPVVPAMVASSAQPEVIEAEVIDSSPPPKVLHPLDRPDEPVHAPPPVPSRPRRALADVLAAFMQERNIRWGELVSGLLIVGSAAGLVISLRATLRDWIPYFPALLFLLGTAAIHGAGLYTLRRWNLRSTSRGVLIISQLLVPLNFLAAIVISGHETEQLPVTSLAYIAAVSIGLTAYSAICYTGAQALLGARWLPTALAVMGASASQLFIHRLLTPDLSQQTTLWLALLPTLSFCTAVIMTLWRMRDLRSLSWKRAEELFLPLGLGSFALLMPLLLIVTRSATPGVAWANLAPLLVLIGAAIVALGTFVASRTKRRALAALATTGTSLAIAGGIGMLGAVALAWPEVRQLFVVGGLAFLSLTLIAWLGRLPVLHVPAIACAALVTLLGYHEVSGTFVGFEDQLSYRIGRSWLMGRSGAVLAGFATLIGLTASVLWQTQRRRDAIYYAGSAVGLAVLSIAVAAYSGFLDGEDAWLATWVFAYFFVVVTIALVIRPQRYLSYAAASLLLVTGVHALGFSTGIQALLETWQLMPARPVVFIVVAQAVAWSLLALVALAWSKRPATWQEEILEPLVAAAFVESLLALPFALLVSSEQFGHHAGYLLAIGFTWIAAAVVYRSPQFITAAQALLPLAIAYGAIAWLQQQSWWDRQAIDARSVYVVTAALALWCLAWSIARRATESMGRVHSLLAPPWPAVDWFVLGGIVVTLLTIPGLAAWRGIDAELSTRTFAFAAPFELLELANSPLVWLAWGLTLAALLAALWERLSLTAVCGLLLLGITPCMVLAVNAQTELASASMMRWSLAGYCALASAVICLRGTINTALRRQPGLLRGELPPYTHWVCLGIVTLRSALPIVGLTLSACSLAARGIAPHGPLAATFFKDIGWSWSYGAPLMVLVVVSVALALREKQSGFMLAGSLLFQMVATLACVMPVLTSGGSFTPELAAEVLQYNALALGLFGLVWLGCERWLERLPVPLVMLQIGTLMAVVATSALWSSGLVLLVPSDQLLTLADTLGAKLSFISIGIGLVATLWFAFRHSRREVLMLTILFGIAWVAAIAIAGRSWDASMPWLSRHVLSGGWLLLAAMSTAIACWLWDRRWRLQEQSASGGSGLGDVLGSEALRQVVACTVGLVVVVLGYAISFADQDPITAWPILLALAALFLCACLGVFSRQYVWAYLTTPLALVVATLAWQAYGPHTATQIGDYFATNLLAVVLVNASWLGWDIFCQRFMPGRVHEQALPTAPRILTPLMTLACAGMMALCVLASFIERAFGGQGPHFAATPTNVILLVVLGTYLLATFWHQQVRTGVECLYLWGLCVVALACDSGNYSSEIMVAWLGTATAAYVALTGMLWQFGARLSLLGQRLGIENPVAALTRISYWLPPVSLVIAIGVLWLEWIVLMHFDQRLLRFAAGFAPALLAIGVGLQAQQARRALMSYGSLLLATVAAVYLSWADLPPGGSEEVWLERIIRVLVVLGSLAIVYGGVLTRVWSHWQDWTKAFWRMAMTCGAGAGVSLVGILAMEAVQFSPGQDSILGTPQVAIVALVLVALAGALVMLAVAPPKAVAAQWLPSEQHRMFAVYAAQVVLALAFGHLYLTRPTWFDGWLRPYWPFIIMALAFLGVGLGEWFERMKLRVLADPLRRSGAFLPLIPAIGWWIESLQGQPATDYALIMFMVGLLYVVYSMFRQSFPAALAAGVAGNVALWSLMHDRGVDFLVHPQFWLIPPAVSVLAAVQVQAKRLREEQIAAARYLCLVTIYLSSTSEIFITGIGDSLWPPMALAALAVLGVMAGIVLQVRAFLYLGTGFVFLAMVTMVWHAAQSLQHVWPWWAFGICLGLAILAFFGMFEKKRVEITALVERLRQWEH